MLEYLYTHKGQYYSGEGTSYKEALKRHKLNPKNFPREDLLCIFVQDPSKEEVERMSKDFAVEEKYFYRFRQENRSMRYSFNPLIFGMTDYVTDGSSKIHIAHLLFVIKHNMLLLVVSEPSKYFKELFDKVIEKTKKRRLKSEAYILYEYLNQDTKENYDVIEQMDDKLAVLENKIINNTADSKDLLREIISMKKYLIKMNERLWASSKIIFTVKKDLTALKLTREEQALLDDIYDTMMHQVDLIESQKETVTDLLEIYTTTLNNKLAEISNKLNIVMKKMAALTIIIMVPTLIAGVYGMNFIFMPELRWASGYVFALAIMIAAASITYYLFHRKEWI